MFKRVFAASIVSAGILAAFCGGNTFASVIRNYYTPGEAVNIDSGNINICVKKNGGYTGDTIRADIFSNNYSTQVNFDEFSGNNECKNIGAVPSGASLRFVTPMGLSGQYYIETTSSEGNYGYSLDLGEVSYANKYINSYGSFNNRIGASKIEVQFDANGGAGTMPAMTNLDPNTNITLDSNSLTRTDYKFVGWNTKADGTGTSYADGETITLANGGIVKLYAQWVQATTTLKTGQNVGAALKTLAKRSSVSYLATDTLIKNLSFVDTLPSTVDENTPKVNIALDGEAPVYAYWVANDEAIYINTKADTIYANQDSSYMFVEMESLTSLTLPDSFDTSNVTDMRGMFSYMYSLTSLTLPDSFDTSKVTKMSCMFEHAEALTSLTLSDSFDTSNVTNMSYMFENMYALASLTLSDSFDTSNVTDMSRMFWDMPKLTSLTLPDSFDTSNVTSMNGMFYGMKSLTSLTLPDSFDTSNVTDMNSMFRDMQALTSLTLPDAFNTSSVTNMGYMFSGMYVLASLTLPASFNTSKVTNMYQMFYLMRSLTSLTLPDSFDTSKVKNMSNMFYYMQDLTSLTLPDSFVITSGTNTSGMFSYILNTATLYATDATARSLWPGVLGN